MAEEHWVAGYLYFNPQDKRLIVPWRRGRRSYVFNCGKPLGFAITAVSILLPVLGLLYFIGAVIFRFPEQSLLIALPVLFVAWRVFLLLRPEHKPAGPQEAPE
jgi:hypothetical protein